MKPGIRGPAPRTSLPGADGQPRRDARAAHVATGIPRFSTGLVGRQRELGEIRALCAEGRLVSLVGPGGIGKTRLAAAVAAELAVDRQIHWVGDTSADPASRVQRLVASIGDQRIQVVLDGWVGGAESVGAVAELMRRNPRARLLVTTRQPLGFDDEIVWRTPGLALDPPPATAARGSEGADPPEAALLFLARSHVVADLRSVEGRRISQLITAICRQLAGVPLAIELVAGATGPDDLTDLPSALASAAPESATAGAAAATGTGAGTAAGIVAATATGTGTGSAAAAGSGGKSETAEAVRAALAFAEGRLGARELALLRRLAVFPATADLSAVCAVGGVAPPLAPPTVRPVLQRLIAAGFVQVLREPTGRRFALPHGVQRLATERLAEVGETGPVHRAHLAHFSSLAVTISPPMVTAGTPTAADLDLLDGELPNFRIAFATVRRLGAPDTATALQLAVALKPFCLIRGHYREGVNWLHTALDASADPPTPLLAAAEAGLGHLSMLLCEYAEATRHLDQALRRYRELSDSRGETETLLGLGSIAREQGRYHDAERLYERALAMASVLNNPLLVARTENYRAFVAWLTGNDDLAETIGRRSLTLFRDLQDSEGIAWSLLTLGVVARHQGASARAVELLEATLSLSEWTGYAEGVAWSCEQLGALALDQRDPAAAEPLLLAALAAHRAVGDRWRSASTFDDLAAVAVQRNEGDQAALLLGSAFEIRREIDVPVPQCERADRDRTELAATEMLSTERFRSLFERGAQQARDDVLFGFPRPPAVAGLPDLRPAVPPFGFGADG